MDEIDEHELPPWLGERLRDVLAERRVVCDELLCEPNQND